MTRANVNDRATICEIYPMDAWEQDGSRNIQGNATVIHGVKIMSAPDPEGAFDLVRMSQHVAENDPESDEIFLSAFEPGAAEAMAGSTYSGGVQPTEHEHSKGGYESFIDSILEAARSAHFKPAIGVGDDRIKGFRGG
ncbi:hypothetical protein IZ6_25940 [Terrihabitans soli]|uniref:Uncharacterized protein n=1 Tax=Terrihabitans soli TaxID=708113 RepID=A0A6S6QS20_9HYPH|nr:hypothetical protein [Terrihabitans soli]BCJ91859.1 hypothetical protein IZ6_25940 [Terrihabitans soli]